MFGVILKKLLPKEFKVPTVLLMVGVDAVGKSTILRNRVNIIHPFSIPLDMIEVGIGENLTIVNVDIGGQDKWIWRYVQTTFPEFNGVIFVGDASCRDDYERSAEEFEKVVKKCGTDLPYLIFANKQDMPNAISADQFTERLKLHEHNVQTLHVQEATASDQQGLKEGFAWLAHTISQNNPRPNPYHNPNYQSPFFPSSHLPPHA